MQTHLNASEYILSRYLDYSLQHHDRQPLGFLLVYKIDIVYFN